jgi:hypothetical protein
MLDAAVTHAHVTSDLTRDVTGCTRETRDAHEYTWYGCVHDRCAARRCVACSIQDNYKYAHKDRYATGHDKVGFSLPIV